MSNAAADKIKVWLFPTLVSIISVFIWQEVKEIKSDVKALLAQSNIDKTRIDNLERTVYGNKTDQTSATLPVDHNSNAPLPKILSFEFILSKNELDEEEDC